MICSTHGIVASSRVSTASLILDGLPASAGAYSLRLLRAGHTGLPVCRVRESGGNTEANIGTVNGELDTVALLAFVGANNGFVVTWYDQSGNARNATQATAANQPRIVNAGVVELNSGKPSINFNGTNWLDFTSASNLTTVSAVFKKDSASGIIQYVIAGIQQGLAAGGNSFPNILMFNSWLAESSINTSLPVITTTVISAGTATLFINGISRATAGSATDVNLSRIGTRPDGVGLAHFGKTSEIVLSTSSFSTADRQALEANQQTFYNI